VVNAMVVVRPMMYLALSYDHRIIEGRDSVSSWSRSRKRWRIRRDCCCRSDDLHRGWRIVNAATSGPVLRSAVVAGIHHRILSPHPPSLSPIPCSSGVPIRLIRVVVIGAAGRLPCAIRAAQNGLKIACIV